MYLTIYFAAHTKNVCTFLGWVNYIRAGRIYLYRITDNLRGADKKRSLSSTGELCPNKSYFVGREQHDQRKNYVLEGEPLMNYGESL